MKPPRPHLRGIGLWKMRSFISFGSVIVFPLSCNVRIWYFLLHPLAIEWKDLLRLGFLIWIFVSKTYSWHNISMNSIFKSPLFHYSSTDNSISFHFIEGINDILLDLRLTKGAIVPELLFLLNKMQFLQKYILLSRQSSTQPPIDNIFKQFMMENTNILKSDWYWSIGLL